MHMPQLPVAESRLFLPFFFLLEEEKVFFTSCPTLFVDDRAKMQRMMPINVSRESRELFLFKVRNSKYFCLLRMIPFKGAVRLCVVIRVLFVKKIASELTLIDTNIKR